MGEIRLTEKSREFIEDLRLYLFASGKKEKEINEIIEELEDHLFEAEKKGKSVDDIIGQNPGEYMKQISVEMDTDKGFIGRYLPVFLVGLMAYFLLERVTTGQMHISVLELVGYPLVSIMQLFITFIVFRFTASRRLSKRREFLLYAGIGGITIASFILLFAADRLVETPVLLIPETGVIIAGIISAGVLITIAFWARTAVPVIIPVILLLPNFFVDILPFGTAGNAVADIVFVYGALTLYIGFTYWKH